MKTIIGVMGPGSQATPEDLKTAYALGNAIARAGWVLLTGGRNIGVMDAASRGAKAAQGLTIGILPTQNSTHISDAVDIPIATGLGQGRNIINILTSRVVIACGNGTGTASEIAHALKANKPIILMGTSTEGIAYWQSLSPSPLRIAHTVEQAMLMVQDSLTTSAP
jgi:uncharacterized protein (TIGR00725 family)